jgi:DNA repair protein RecO
MSHRIYHTEAFVLKHRLRGEDSKLLYLFTPDFGLILVVAQGVRKQASKMRPNIPDYSYGHYSLVRGREFWRLVSAEKRGDFDFAVSSLGKREIVGNIFNLLLLLSGEEESSEVFEDLKQALGWLSRLKSDDALLMPAEKLLVLRLLSHLGYLKADEVLDALVEGEWSEDKLKKLVDPLTSQHSASYINKVLRELNR